MTSLEKTLYELDRGGFKRILAVRLILAFYYRGELSTTQAAEYMALSNSAVWPTIKTLERARVIRQTPRRLVNGTRTPPKFYALTDAGAKIAKSMTK